MAERGKLPELTAEQRAASAAMLLPYRLRFKRVQTDNRTVKNHKACWWWCWSLRAYAWCSA